LTTIYHSKGFVESFQELSSGPIQVIMKRNGQSAPQSHPTRCSRGADCSRRHLGSRVERARRAPSSAESTGPKAYGAPPAGARPAGGLTCHGSRRLWWEFMHARQRLGQRLVRRGAAFRSRARRGAAAPIERLDSRQCTRRARCSSPGAHAVRPAWHQLHRPARAMEHRLWQRRNRRGITRQKAERRALSGRALASPSCIENAL
jgi:hypothetical protein